MLVRRFGSLRGWKLRATLFGVESSISPYSPSSRKILWKLNIFCHSERNPQEVSARKFLQTWSKWWKIELWDPYHLFWPKQWANLGYFTPESGELWAKPSTTAIGLPRRHKVFGHRHLRQNQKDLNIWAYNVYMYSMDACILFFLYTYISCWTCLLSLFLLFLVFFFVAMLLLSLM